MTARLSTGLVNKMLDTGAFRTIFALGFIDIYSGAQPATADAAATGTKLATIYSNGSSVGLSWEAAAVGGSIAKAVGETWSQTSATASGTAGWFRVRGAAADTGALSTTLPRYDGAIATSGGEMNLASLTITAGSPFIIDTAVFTLPMV